MSIEGHKNWCVSREVSVGHIVSTVALLLAAVMTWFSMDTRITILETKYEAHTDAQVTQENRQDDVNKAILRNIKEITDIVTDIRIKIK